MYLEAAKEIKGGFYVNDNVKEEFIAQELTINSKGKPQLVPKIEIKEVLGHSPDYSDATALAIYAMNHQSKEDDYSKSVDEYLYYMSIREGYGDNSSY